MAEGRGGESFGAYEARVKRYSWSWFRDDVAATEILRQRAEVRARVYRLAAGFQTVGTELLYQAGGRWIDERGRLHQKVMHEALRYGGFDAGNDGRDAVPQAVLLLGLPGSGKTSLLRPVAHELIRRTAHTSNVVLDTDVVRTIFPEYAGGLGSEVVHPETSFVTNRLLLDEVYRLRVNIVLDKVGDPAWTVEQAEFLLRDGWSVWCLCARLDVEVAVERAKRRAVESGRYVPPDLIRERGQRPIEAYYALRDSKLDVTGCALLDTDVPAGERPLVIDAITEQLFGKEGMPVAVWPEVREADR